MQARTLRLLPILTTRNYCAQGRRRLCFSVPRPSSAVRTSRRWNWAQGFLAARPKGSGTWAAICRSFPCLPTLKSERPWIFCQSGWSAGVPSHYNPPPLLFWFAAGSADDRAWTSESIAEMHSQNMFPPSVGMALGLRRNGDPVGASRQTTLMAAPQAADSPSADDLRLRIAWGGGAERLWQGTISLSEGALSEPAALGRRGRRAGVDVARRPPGQTRRSPAEPADLRRRRPVGLRPTVGKAARAAFGRRRFRRGDKHRDPLGRSRGRSPPPGHSTIAAIAWW